MEIVARIKRFFSPTWELDLDLLGVKLAMYFPGTAFRVSVEDGTVVVSDDNGSQVTYPMANNVRNAEAAVCCLMRAARTGLQNRSAVETGSVIQ